MKKEYASPDIQTSSMANFEGVFASDDGGEYKCCTTSGKQKCEQHEVDNEGNPFK